MIPGVQGVFLQRAGLWLTSFELSKVILGCESERKKSKEMNYSSLNFSAISFVSCLSASDPSINFNNAKLTFGARSQHLGRLIGTKESVYIWKEFNSHRTGLGHQHGRRVFVLEQQYGPRDVMWKRSIRSGGGEFSSPAPRFKIPWEGRRYAKVKSGWRRTSSRGSMSAIKGKDPGRIVQDNPGLVENLNSKMKVWKAN